VIFGRSWYNRAGVEAVMSFCTPAVGVVPRAQKKSYNDRKSIAKRRFVEEYY
jgi:polyphosphate kinase 2 (PPK2 family)